jgi:hypothetical protein
VALIFSRHMLDKDAERLVPIEWVLAPVALADVAE